MAFTSTANLKTYSNNLEALSDKPGNLGALMDEVQAASPSWDVVTGTTQQATANASYLANNGSLVTVTLPTAAAVGTMIRVAGLGAGGWRVAQNASQLVHKSGTATTTGTGGHIDSGNRYDAVTLLCVVANTEWDIIASQGTIATT